MRDPAPLVGHEGHHLADETLGSHADGAAANALGTEVRQHRGAHGEERTDVEGFEIRVRHRGREQEEARDFGGVLGR